MKNDVFRQAVTAAIDEVFPNRRVFPQEDIVTTKGAISMRFLRETGIPTEPLTEIPWLQFEFNAVTCPLRETAEILENDGETVPEALRNSVCLNYRPKRIVRHETPQPTGIVSRLFPGTKSRTTSEAGNEEQVFPCCVTYLDLDDGGAVKRWFHGKEFMFVNSSLELYVASHAFYVKHRREGWEAKDEETYFELAEEFVHFLPMLDKRALDAGPESYWNRMIEMIETDYALDICLGC